MTKDENFSSDDINNPSDVLKMTSAVLQEMGEATSNMAGGLAAYSVALRNFSKLTAGYAEEREFFVKIITAILLDSGMYDYTIQESSVEDLEGYGYSMDFNPEKKSVTFKVQFPHQDSQE